LLCLEKGEGRLVPRQGTSLSGHQKIGPKTIYMLGSKSLNLIKEGMRKTGPGERKIHRREIHHTKGK